VIQDSEGKSSDELRPLVRNVVLDRKGNIIKEWGSVLPDAIYERILALSFAYIDDPDDGDRRAYPLRLP
jgi:hypothetical protein